jgi:hypothetical protein
MGRWAETERRAQHASVVAHPPICQRPRNVNADSTTTGTGLSALAVTQLPRPAGAPAGRKLPGVEGAGVELVGGDPAKAEPAAHRHRIQPIGPPIVAQRAKEVAAPAIGLAAVDQAAAVAVTRSPPRTGGRRCCPPPVWERHRPRWCHCPAGPKSIATPARTMRSARVDMAALLTSKSGTCRHRTPRPGPR